MIGIALFLAVSGAAVIYLVICDEKARKDYKQPDYRKYLD